MQNPLGHQGPDQEFKVVVEGSGSLDSKLGTSFCRGIT